ncbi:zinc finger MYM-type protein 1-like isoform X3 [Leptinotarsa decemlineata]|uniref:zinc finger MYM-type protein 1-like isoform X3 n=1 Tax=Leptinotarsa decemlineata TaxID=7539 RepID=UPI003D3045A7
MMDINHEESTIRKDNFLPENVDIKMEIVKEEVREDLMIRCEACKESISGTICIHNMQCAGSVGDINEIMDDQTVTVQELEDSKIKCTDLEFTSYQESCLDSKQFSSVDRYSVKREIKNEINQSNSVDEDNVFYESFGEQMTSEETEKNFQTNADERLIQCNFCSRSFTDFRYLKNHEKFHKTEISHSSTVDLGRNKYKCEICLKSFFRSSTLQRHSKIHTGKKPYKCKGCSKSFSESFALKKHSRIHNSRLNIHSRVHMDKLDEIKKSDDIVDWLLTNNFKSLSYDIKFYIIKTLGRPQPNFISIKAPDNRQNRGFNISWYDKCDWLTGSIKREKLFCWPCVLFSVQTEYQTWSKIGYSDLKNLPRSIERHFKSKEHIFSSCKLRLFSKQNIATALNTAQKEAIISFNNQVRENRSNLRRLIDITIYLGSQESAFLGHDETEDSINRGNYKELLMLWGKYDSQFGTFLNSSVFSGTSKTIQNELIDSVAYIIKENISKEIESVSFFAWEIDETIDSTCTSQLSIVFRYVKDGNVVERFMGFHDVPSGRTADDLFDFLIRTCDTYNFRQKLIAQTYDGAAVMAGHLNGLQTKIKSIAPHAVFTHCYAHDLNSVLSKACNNIKDCRVFFSSLSAFSAFFSKSTKRTHVLNEICGSRMPTFAATRWNSTSRAVISVHTNKDKLIDVFDFILNSDDFKTDDQSLREARGFKYILNDHKFCFLLEIFKLIFERTDVVFSILQNKSTNINYSKQRLNNLTEILMNFRNNDTFFNNIFESIDLTLEPPAPTKRKTNLDLLDLRRNYKQIYNEILDTFLTQIKVRFEDLLKLNYFDLLLFKKFSSYTKDFPQKLYNDLIAQYPFFDAIQLKNELIVMYSDPEMFQNCKSPSDLLNFIFKNDLRDFMPELYKLLSIIVTIPITSASVDRNVSALERIKSFSRNSMTLNRNRLSNISLLSIEKEYIKEVTGNPRFYDEVIDYFANFKNRKIPLIFKAE